jgi:sugar phosphate isomerase/epimerase
VQSEVSRVTERAWSLLGKYFNTVHVKDALLDYGKVKAAGEGDGQVKDFLEKLLNKGFNGFLSIEHHLGRDPQNMYYAVNALRKITTKLGYVESKIFKGD